MKPSTLNRRSNKLTDGSETYDVVVKARDGETIVFSAESAIAAEGLYNTLKHSILDAEVIAH